MIARRDILSASLALGLPNWSGANTSNAEVLTKDVDLTVGGGLTAMPVRILYPAGRRRLPVVLFSHGAYSSGRLYDGILKTWAAAGFAVFAVTHRDSVALGVQRGASDPRYFGWRLEDMESLYAAIETVAAQAPGLPQRLETAKLFVTGHSFGGLVAQTLAGATYFDVASGKTIDRRIPNARAAIVFSGAGRFAPLLRTEDFAALTIPLLVTVGTEDLKQAPDLSGYQWRKEPYDLARSPRRYLLTLNGCDHYLGGLVGRDDLPIAPQARDWLQIFNSVTTQFLLAAKTNRRGPWLRPKSDKLAVIAVPAAK